MVDWESFYNAFRTPDFIPGYEIQHRLGGGAFGEVYKARKLSIGKAYAIKFLKLDDQADRAVIERELEQVRLFASIDHPNLVTIEDMGMVRDVPYLILGYAGEETLARRLKLGGLEPDAALRTFVQVCRGVLALHDRRLAHFDLKPGNVFLKGEVARVGDYGLAKLLVEGRSSLSFGRGTPHYMAPEMLKNRADHRADVYSLGVILYECLTGRVPYGAELGGVVLREDDVPPAFPPAFPAALRATVETCLRLVPDDRFDSVHELLLDLGQTARQGDSVHLPLDVRPGPAEAMHAAEGARGPLGAERRGPAADPGTPHDRPTPRDADTPTRGDDLRTAAGHLARGAVGVARGVWDGVRGRGETPTPGEGQSPGAADRAGSPPPADPPGRPDGPPAPDHPALTGGAEASSRDDRRSEAALRPGGAHRDDVISVQTLGDDPPPRLPLGAALGARLPVERPPAGAPWTAALTVPVPPRDRGGAIGAMASTAVLGAEVLGALVTGPVLALLRGVGGVLDRSLHGLPGAVGAAARLLVFVLVCFCLGAATALVFLGAVMGGNLYIH